MSWRQTPEQRGKKKQLCRESCLERSYPCGTLRNRPLKRKNKEKITTQECSRTPLPACSGTRPPPPRTRSGSRADRQHPP